MLHPRHCLVETVIKRIRRQTGADAGHCGNETVLGSGSAPLRTLYGSNVTYGRRGRKPNLTHGGPTAITQSCNHGHLTHELTKSISFSILASSLSSSLVLFTLFSRLSLSLTFVPSKSWVFSPFVCRVFIFVFI